MKFGDYLRQVRTERGWTQPEAAARAGIEQSYLSKLETGKSVPSSEIYDRLVGAYGIVPGEMLGILSPTELERLREIDSVRSLLIAQSNSRRLVPRYWLAAGLAGLALGGGFLGLSTIDPGRDVTTYTYVSEGVLPPGAEPGTEPPVRSEQTRFLTEMRGPLFTEKSAEGVREWHLVGGGAHWQPARFGWALVPGLAFLFAGFGFFFLAWRWR